MQTANGISSNDFNTTMNKEAVKTLIILTLFYTTMNKEDCTTMNYKEDYTTMNKEAVKTLIILTLFYVICNCPLVLFDLIVGLIGMIETPTTIQITLFTAIFSNLNAGMNSMIYILRTKKLRTFLKSIFSRKEV